ncbi:HNH endonuclease signature motif containing protein [Geodermatophilus sp. DSM 44513]|uniref:HNH endonuclease signature motif containing protein n=1 Tax=Geodermatophilus sp. DSM 44513 TaxID=1528104 RepID=UPI001287C7A4|nr:HNH endonuclease signature motif containing protein [Geodermatophilus sp. DSM 44513]WNV73738.1 DUF222 domain-containing protein [Geodermatophilus sp. DSM 44513]
MELVAGQVSSAEGVLIDWAVARPVDLPRLPVSLLSREQKAAELARVRAQRAKTAAYEAQLVMALADDTPDTLDPPPGHPGASTGSWAPDGELPGVSEFFTAELAVILNCGRGTAAHLATRAAVWRERLPATLAAMSAGVLDEARAKVLAEACQHIHGGIAGQLEVRLLPEAAGLSMRRLRARATELLIELDADAVDARREEAQRQADVRTWPSHLEGMATFAAELPADEAAEAYDLVDQLAQMAKADGDTRPIGQLRTEICSLLLRRPADSGLPAATAHVTVTATLDAVEGRTNTPGSVDGLPITAGHLRDLLHRAGALGLQAPPGGSLTFALTDQSGRLLATADPNRLRRAARRGCPTHPGGQCGCAVLGRPPATDAYTPTAAQTAFVTTRDRGCRFPNCGQRAAWADRDHVVPHAGGGPTDCANLCCLCRSHHRLKTHARGWTFVMLADGTLHVTTPSGVTRTTRPPGLRPPRPRTAETPGEEPAGREPLSTADDEPPPF